MLKQKSSSHTTWGPEHTTPAHSTGPPGHNPHDHLKAWYEQGGGGSWLNGKANQPAESTTVPSPSPPEGDTLAPALQTSRRHPRSRANSGPQDHIQAVLLMAKSMGTQRRSMAMTGEGGEPPLSPLDSLISAQVTFQPQASAEQQYERFM
ncbi:Hypothetical predicted protein [Pelobates cultripes]|uniref:Uncharacterized protein n=1 Tax=Pelobates cultripes TaxID=61616 RepID=A0AAD1S6L0_PELCU|nr:Hypothetical predicted protein [Pelobates cultripes]